MASSDSSEAPSRVIRNDLLSMDSAFAEAMEWMDHMKVEINQAKEKLQELQTSGGSQRQIDELKQAVEKLESKLPPLLKVCRNPPYRHRHPRTNVDETEDGMTHFSYLEPKVAQRGDFEPLKDFHKLPEPLRCCLLCFFKFPPLATIKKTTLINLWIRQGLISWHLRGTEEYPPKEKEELPREEDAGNEVFDELVAKGFINPVTQYGSLEPDTCRMRLSVRSSLYRKAEDSGYTVSKSNPRYRHRRPWSNVNEAEEGMTHFSHWEPEVVHSGDFKGHLEAFDELPELVRCCLLCFFKFPPMATIKKTTLIYLWIGQGFISWHVQGREEYPPKEKEELPREEDAGKKIFDVLVDKGFIEPIYQNCSLVPDSCRMRLSVRSVLYEAAKASGFTSNGTLDLDLGLICGDLPGHSCLINVGEAIINWEPEIIKNMKHIKSLYLGKWQSSTTHHIELAEAKILSGLKNLKRLKFFSLRGVSMITELPTSILDLKDLKILDFQACHNLEAIPNNIGLLKRLTHLDMSECYLLEHMPKSLAQLSNLEVLKGFFIGDLDSNKESSTLYDLSRLPKLRKLNIYISVKGFHRLWDFDDLRNFKVLQKLTISWGGCSLQGDNGRQGQEEASMELLRRGPLILPSGLQKLDLHCFPAEGLIDWLRLARIMGLKKLYIRGGQLYNLGQSRKHQGEHWNVEILRLKYLSELEIDWGELRILFPKLIYLHQVGCPKLTNFPCDESGVWMDRNAIYIQEQLQKYSRTSDIGSSSMVESGPTFDQDDCNICSIDE